MLDPKNDMLIIIDMNNGFVYEGALASPNVAALVPKMQNFVKKCLAARIEVWHYVDAHAKGCPEFNVYPEHCVAGTKESEVIPELNFPEVRVIPKNSTNGFLARNPFEGCAFTDPSVSNNSSESNECRGQAHGQAKNLYIIGCVTDICVHDFAFTAIKYVHEYNLPHTVTVIGNLCATFDAPDHNSTMVHAATLAKLKREGVNIAEV